MKEHQVSQSTGSVSATNIRVAFWNLQNLFGVETSAIAAELDYTPAFGWTRNAVERKISNLAEIIRSMFGGQGPDLLGICEIENEDVADRLLKEIGRDDLRLVRVSTADETGLNTALICSDLVFDCDQVKCRGHNVFQRYPVFDISEAHLTIRENQSQLTVLVNHWPSRKPDPHSTEPYRMAVARQCGQIIDDLLKLTRRQYLQLNDNDVALYQLNQAWDRNILVMGDLNGDPWSRSVMEVLNAGYSARHMDDSIEMLNDCLPSWRFYHSRRAPLFNPMLSLMTTPDQGSRFIESASQTATLPDQFLLSRGLYLGANGIRTVSTTDGVPDVQIYSPDVMTNAQRQPIEFRVDSLSGYSDHFPVTLELQTVSAGENA